MPKPFKPQIVTANDLLDGAVVYFRQDGEWSHRYRDAYVLANPNEAEDYLKRAQQQAARIVEPYLVETGFAADGTPAPLHYREIMRTRGPSNRPDLCNPASSAA